MTREDLNARVEKKNQEIAKIQKRIAKWTTGMSEEAKSIAAACEVVYGDPKHNEVWKNYKDYKSTHTKDSTVFRQDYEWNKGPNIEEAARAYSDLAEAKATLNKYLVQLDALSNFENEEKIEAIWNFLMNWRQQAYDYYVNEVKTYHDLKNSYSDDWKEFKNSIDYEDQLNSYRNNRWAEYEIENRFRRKYFQDIDALTRDIYLPHGKVDEKKLNKHLDEEVKRKYTRLVNEVTEKAGEIVDASNLRINQRGEINGRIKGTKNDVDLWLTFVEGEIQCPHYRGYCRVAK